MMSPDDLIQPDLRVSILPNCSPLPPPDQTSIGGLTSGRN
ncbi:MAG: hypothetical protein ACI8RZ_007491, partial [Myxococcota bacterium]